MTPTRPRPEPAEVARALQLAEQDRLGIEFPSERFAREGWTLDWSYARAVARERDALRRADGEVQVGWKLGWTSAAMRDALGLDSPNWGTLWSSQVVDDATIDLDELIHPKVEPEFVWRGGRWHLGLEIVDPRFPSFGFAWLDNTLDNSSAARVVIGEPLPLDADLLADARFEMLDGSTILESNAGSGAQVMGHPERAVAWLRVQLADEGATLGDDELVFTGGLTAPFDLVAGRSYRLTVGDATLTAAVVTSSPRG